MDSTLLVEILGDFTQLFLNEVATLRMELPNQISNVEGFVCTSQIDTTLVCIKFSYDEEYSWLINK